MSKRLTAVFSCAVMLMLALALSLAGAQTSLAQDPGNGQNSGSVHVHLHDVGDNVHPAGVKLCLYEVAQGSYFEHEAHLLPDFAEEQTHHNVDDVVTNSIGSAADLEIWAETTHHASPLFAVASDASGEVDFDGLEDGVYLICQESAGKKNSRVDVRPFIVEVPMQNDTGDLDYLLDCHPKLMIMSVDEDHCDVTVEKHWEDDNDARGIRPSSLDVQLLCDGEVQETVALDASTNWIHAWKGLDAKHDWSVKEAHVPAGYKASITHEGTIFYITNTIETEDEPTPPSNDTPSDTPGSNTPGSKTPTNASSTTAKDFGSSALPTTGDPIADALILALILASIVAAIASAISLAVLKRRITP